MNINFKILILTLLLTTSVVVASSASPVDFKQLNMGNEDFDPLVDLEVTVDIKAIRALDTVDLLSDPDFYVKVFINDQEFTSETWSDTKYIYNPEFSSTFNVPDDIELVNIKIQLWDANSNGDRLCDISGDSAKSDVELTYSLKTGHWTGEDSIGDPSGYGRLNGCDDGLKNKLHRDSELWFDIYQNDFDGDGIPYWTEVNVYGTDPTVNDTGSDADGDGVPIEWEWKWGYDPSVKESHSTLDTDIDGLSNVEEYLTSQWGSDPFRQDIFIELDQMETSPDGIESILPTGGIELLNTAFDRQNKVLHIDNGGMGGGEMIPFDVQTTETDLEYIYSNYFLHGNQNNWRKGVFRYGLIVYDPGGGGYNFEHGAYVVGSKYTDRNLITKKQQELDKKYASVYMHELGHTLSLHSQGVDNRNTYWPWQTGWWIYGAYRSCMNYRYVYRLVDYSDGSHGITDSNDWGDMDLTRFQNPW